MEKMFGLVLTYVFLCVFVFLSIGSNVASIKQKEYKMNKAIDLIGHPETRKENPAYMKICEVEYINETLSEMIDEDYLTESGKCFQTGVRDFRFENDDFVIELEVEC